MVPAHANRTFGQHLTSILSDRAAALYSIITSRRGACNDARAAPRSRSRYPYVQYGTHIEPWRRAGMGSGSVAARHNGRILPRPFLAKAKPYAWWRS